MRGNFYEKEVFKLQRGGGNRLASHIKEFNLIRLFNNLAPWGENKFVSEQERTYKFQRGVNNILDCHAIARNDVKFMRHPELGATHVALCDSVGSYYRHWCRAFTLAEVLITLGIIGVVAALTMPTLINNINNKANINKLKREYSLFQQAFQQIAADNDLEFKNAVADCPNSTKHACLKDIFKSKLKTVADCDSNDGDNLGKCFVQDKDAKKLNGESVPLYAGYFNQNTTSGLVLDDGASAAIWLDAMDCTNALSSVKQRCGWFVIDVNGPQKRPNTWGKDLFLFFLYADQIMPADENTMDYANYRDDCETGTNYGLTCASKYLFE